jgi:hypothetical protein
MPIGPNGERLPYPGEQGGPPMGPPVGNPMGLMGGMQQETPADPFAPPPDLAAGAAPDMRGMIMQRLEELEMEKGQLVAALQQMEGGGMQGGLGNTMGGPPMGAGLLQPTV